MLLQGQGRVVFWFALMCSRAGRAHLPYWRHLVEVTFDAWRLSSLRRLTCCNATSELFGLGLRAGVAGACVGVLSVGCGLEGGRLRLYGQGRLVYGCALMHARAGTSDLPYTWHLLEDTFRAWRLSSVLRLTCCNATSELFG